MKKYSFKRTLLGFWNIREYKKDDVIVTVDLKRLKQLVPEVNENRFCGEFKALPAEVMEVAK